MSELKPGSFRVYDPTCQRYMDEFADEYNIYFLLNQQGYLMFWNESTNEFDHSYEGFVVEFWAQTHDKTGRPAYENDVFAVVINRFSMPLVLTVGKKNHWCFKAFLDEPAAEITKTDLIGLEYCRAVEWIGTIHDNHDVLKAKAKELLKHEN